MRGEEGQRLCLRFRARFGVVGVIADKAMSRFGVGLKLRDYKFSLEHSVDGGDVRGRHKSICVAIVKLGVQGKVSARIGEPRCRGEERHQYAGHDPELQAQVTAERKAE